ncbi:MAG TPA: hypothetical protein QF753_06565 [Victivallales bacterium]|nr:hypothetical protein [Victivallales bacterium]
MYKLKYGKYLQNKFVSRDLLILFSFIFIISLSSCFNIPTNKPVNTFDLGIPKTIYLKGIDIGFVDFLNDSDTKHKMLYRVGKNRVEYDPFNKWSVAPDRLLSNYLKASFSTKSASPKNIALNLTGSVYSFQIDLITRQVRLGVKYRIRSKGKFVKEYKEIIITKYTQETPVGFAEAMTKNAEKLVNTITKQIQNIKKNVELSKKNVELSKKNKMTVKLK